MTAPCALITGASQGLGEHLALSFWRSGWNIALVSRNHHKLERLVSSLEKRPNQSAAIFPCDLSDQVQVAAIVDQISSKIPTLKVLINNAAIHGSIGPFIKSDLSLWNKVIQVNFLAPVYLCHGLVDLLAKSNSGSIINISGGGATSLRPNFSAYASAKTALVRFSETIAEELKQKNIRVNCIAPGPMKTDLLKEVCLSSLELVGEKELSTANKVFADDTNSMDRVSDLALFLANEKSKGVTGKIISAVWDRWQVWPEHLSQLQSSDAYTLRRISGRERDMNWGDL
jgi:NAD(P)-dependent dehydrogenase (short-subunit alcohol dehydrogenase family)